MGAGGHSLAVRGMQFGMTLQTWGLRCVLQYDSPAFEFATIALARPPIQCLTYVLDSAYTLSRTRFPQDPWCSRYYSGNTCEDVHLENPRLDDVGANPADQPYQLMENSRVVVSPTPKTVEDDSPETRVEGDLDHPSRR